MKTKTIDKLEDLKGYEWEERGLKLKLDGFDIKNQTLQLHSENFLSEIGDYIGRFEFVVSKYNLEQLEFYGLKVILNEKPKISVADKEFLEKEMYFAREGNGTLYVYFEKPVQDIEDGQWEVSTYNTFDCFPIDEEKFPFITWESGKAWSKAELMELEVVE